LSWDPAQDGDAATTTVTSTANANGSASGNSNGTRPIDAATTQSSAEHSQNSQPGPYPPRSASLDRVLNWMQQQAPIVTPDAAAQH
jgi:hypothetical protein